ncbi:MAG: PQQ-dependent sugar dehydrogenase [Gemmatimonadaceae bacterium]
MRYLKRWIASGIVAALTFAVACGSNGDGPSEPPPPATGALTINISGLPSGVTAAVTVTGPGGFSRTLTASETMASLTPGAYTVASANVTTSNGRYAASPGSQPITVTAGPNPVVAAVTYALATGGLTVNIAGLAAGATAHVTVTGPGFTRALTATETFPVLEPGTYTISATEVTASETRYAALPPTQSIAVTPGVVSAASVLYTAATGQLAVTILGLPAGSPAAVTVSGPNGFTRTLSATTTLTLLVPGNYTVTSSDAQAGNFTYRGAGAVTQTIPVPASTNAASTTVRYQAIDGALSVVIAGLPSGVLANVTLTGPAGFTTTIQQNRTQQRLAQGVYTVTANAVNAGTSPYAAAPDVQVATVSVGATASVTVNYAPSISLRLEPVLSGLSRPVQLVSPPGDPSRMLILEQTGLVKLVKNGQLLVAPFLDLTTRIHVPQGPDDERGALGIAFHPQYNANGQFFVYYIGFGQNIVVDRFQVSGNPDAAFPNGTPVLTLPKTDPRHNGGAIAFGADGYLYIGIGDGACCNDPDGNGQSTNTLFGKVLRLDVDTPPYSIPPTNPFFGQPGRRGEIWAYGLRNPWRIDLDATASIVYIADVGESAFEEVNAVSAFQGGYNFGWNVMEGPQCRAQPTCNTQFLTPPVISYGHSQGCSVTGGHVYRGVQIPELIGHYFYSDFCRGFLRSFRVANGIATQQRDWGIPSPGSVTSFGKDAFGELYVLTLAGGVFKIVRQ